MQKNTGALVPVFIIVKHHLPGLIQPDSVVLCLRKITRVVASEDVTRAAGVLPKVFETTKNASIRTRRQRAGFLGLCVHETFRKYPFYRGKRALFMGVTCPDVAEER